MVTKFAYESGRSTEADPLNIYVHIGPDGCHAEAATESMEPKCRPKGQGGLNHGTFKATCRRQGEWKEDWSELLANPLNDTRDTHKVLHTTLCTQIRERMLLASWSTRTLQLRDARSI